MSPASTFNTKESQLGQRRQTHLPREGVQGFARQVPSAQAEENCKKTRL